MIALACYALRLGEPLPRLDSQVGLPCAAVEHARRCFEVGRERLEEVRLWTHLLLGVRDAEGLIEHRVELDLASPPVVVVLPVLAPHEKPAVVDFAPSAHDRHPGTLRNASAALLVVGEFVPLVNR